MTTRIIDACMPPMTAQERERVVALVQELRAAGFLVPRLTVTATDPRPDTDTDQYLSRNEHDPVHELVPVPESAPVTN